MSLSPAVWSAAAASFAALSALLTMRIHHYNYVESVRPELVLDNWSRVTEDPEVLRIARIRNVGRGPALDLHVASCCVETGDRTLALMTTRAVPLIAANEEFPFNGDIHIYWHNVASDGHGYKHLEAPVVLTCSDRRGWRHKFKYDLCLYNPRHGATRLHVVMPGVILCRSVDSIPGWPLEIAAKLSKLPWVGRKLRVWAMSWGA